MHLPACLLACREVPHSLHEVSSLRYVAQRVLAAQLAEQARKHTSP